MIEERRQRVVEFLLGELDVADCAAFERESSGDPELAAMVDELRPIVGRLESLPDESWEPVEPPPLVMPGSAPETGRPRPVPSPGRAGFGWLRAGAGLAAAFVILAAGVLIGLQFDGSDPADPGPDRTLALSSFGDAPAGATGEVALASSSGDAATVDVSGLRPTGPSKFYELWLLGDDGRLVALGSFRVKPNGRSQIKVPLPVNPDDYRYFDISVQPDNGDPEHSGVSVLRGVTRT